VNKTRRETGTKGGNNAAPDAPVVCRTTSLPNARARESGASSTPVWAPAYFAALEVCCGQKTKAAKAAGVTPRSVQRRRVNDNAFAAAESEHMQIVKDIVESEITRRAVDGVVRKKYDRNGNLVSEEVEYSDTLILRLAERLETGSWRQKQQIEHSTPGMFKTETERKAALQEARRLAGRLTPVAELTSRSGNGPAKNGQGIHFPHGRAAAFGQDQMVRTNKKSVSRAKNGRNFSRWERPRRSKFGHVRIST
jgi:hypothetical protein